MDMYKIINERGKEEKDDSDKYSSDDYEASNKVKGGGDKSMISDQSNIPINLTN
jgi:hypothetical protein